MPIKNLKGQKFGKLTVLERDMSRIGGAAYWICQCECGTIKSIRGSNLTTSNHPTKSCGCLNKEKHHNNIDTTSQIGKKYGRLTVLKRDLEKPIGHKKGSYWICQCECGNIISVALSSLTKGSTKSCGCLKREFLTNSNTKDITGLQSGLLTALRRTKNKTAKNEWLWECQCECGNIIFAPTSALTSKHIQSCGCLSMSLGEYYIQKILIENNIHYTKEFSFSNLKSNKNGYLRFDFAILDNNNQPIRLIEFDGEQHYNQRSQYYSQELIENDMLKNNFCLLNDIPLIRIPYTEINNLSLELILGDKYLCRQY